MPSVGCVRIHVPSPSKYASLFSTNDASVWGEFAGQPMAFAFFSRFMVHAKYRGKAYGYTDALYAAAAVEARKMGARFLLLNCTPALAPLYEAKGWIRLHAKFNHIWPILKKLADEGPRTYQEGDH